MEHIMLWAAVFVCALLIEGLSMQLTSIWFAGGALVALILAALKAPIWLQIVIFVLVSAMLVIFTRPLVRKYIQPKVQKTNADSLEGKPALVIESYDVSRDAGLVKVFGQIWSAKPKDGEESFQAGETVRVAAIEGVKLIVEKIKS